MREGWRATTLGEAAEVVGGGTPSTKEPSYWGGDVLWITPSEVTAQEGRVISKTERTLTATGLENSSAKLLPPGTALLTSRATIGAVALAGAEMATNQGFASLVPRRNIVLPEYLMYWCQLNKDEFIRRAGGNTFKEISKKKVASVPFSIPPLTEQQRIVDLISSIDQAIAEALGQSNAADRALEGLMEALLLQDGPDEKFGDLVDMRSGPSWKAADESTEPVEGSVPVIKITNTRPDGELDLTERVFVKNLPESTRRLNGGSLLMIRTNGNRDRIGNVYRVTAEAVDHTYSAFQIGIFPKEAAFSDYLYWFIRSPAVQNAITDSASGTTGLGNIALSWLRELSVPWPDEERRLRVVQVLDSVEEVRSNALNEDQRLKAARAAILSDLLSGSTTIPDSYDRLLEDAS